jgi:hypothetical protein
MNGEHREELVATRLGRPTGLTIDDYMNDRVFWCDSKENLIESMNADGSDRVTVIGRGRSSKFDLISHYRYIVFFQKQILFVLWACFRYNQSHQC